MVMQADLYKRIEDSRRQDVWHDADMWRLVNQARCCQSRAVRQSYRLLGQLGCWLLVLLLAGCGTPVPPTPTPEPVVITFAFPADQAAIYDDLISRFNDEQSSTTVERRTVGAGETWDYLFEQEQVDSFTFSTGNSLFMDRMGEDGVLNLTPLIQESDALDLDDYYPSVLEPFAIEGSVWAIPFGVNVSVMYYNVDLFDQYSAPHPQAGWTWDDMLDAALYVRDPDEDIYGLVAFPWASIPLIYQHGGTIVHDWRMPTRTTLDDPLTIEAVEWFAGLVHDWDVMPSPETASKTFGQGGNVSYIYWRGKAGMYVGFYSDRGGEAWGPDARWRMKWGMLPLPRDESSATLGIANAHAISADTEYPDACWDWLMFLNDQIPPYVMPARRSLAESDAYRERAGTAAASVALASIDDALIIAESPTENALNTEGLSQALIDILNGEISAMEALLDLQRQAEL